MTHSTPTSPDPSPLAGRHALVTGGSRGIGAAIARELARLGASLTLVGRDEARLRAVAAEIGGADVLALDLGDRAVIARALQAVTPAPLILVNNAGQAPSARLEEITLADWDLAFQVNVTAALLAIQAVLPAMRAANWGRIVNVASTAGLTGYSHVAGYVASKHALVGLTRAAAVELAKTGITVNAVCPGYTDTDIAARAVENLKAAGKTEAEARALLARRNPQGRLIDPAEVAQAVGWLCLPGSAAITGQAIAVAGGEVM